MPGVNPYDAEASNLEQIAVPETIHDQIEERQLEEAKATIPTHQRKESATAAKKKREPNQKVKDRFEKQAQSRPK